MFNLLKRFKKQKTFDITQKYYSFKNLLITNNDLLNLFSQLQKEVNKVFININLFYSLTYRILDATFRLIQNFNDFVDNKYEVLYERFLRVDKKIRSLLEAWQPISTENLTIPLLETNLYTMNLVGGKAAHLGEVKTSLNLPIPNGFTITTTAYKRFIEFNNLKSYIEKKLFALSSEDLSEISSVSDELQLAIKEGEVPQEIREAISKSWDNLSSEPGFSGQVAVRSSAFGEDAQFSFAGQFSSVLNVNQKDLLEAYKQVLASKYAQPAIVYRIQKGIKDEQMPMAVLVTEMIDAKAAGVVYTIDPNQPQAQTMVITSTWGIGEAVVQGRVSTDYFLISRNTDELTSKIALKEKKLVLSNKGLEEKKVPLEFGKKPSLTEEELKLLKQYALILEDYFGSPQDIEYAVDKKAKIFILQTRALRVLVKTTRGEKISSKKEAILEGSSAVSGIAAGPVFVLDGKDLAQVPEGAVLVAKHSSPELSAIVSKVSGIITDLGNPSGHMATVARELQVPAIFGTHKATSILKDGQIVTLDADVGIVYRGRIESLLKTKQELQPLTIKNPKHKKIRETLDLTMPLNLLDPRSSTFSPKHCQTIHDIVRFIHEISIQTMFNLGDKAVYSRKVKVVRLVSHLPVPVYLIDLGGGITERAANAKTIKPDDVFSIPFCALWHGMDHPKIHWSGPIGVNIEGFMSVLMRSMVGAEAQLGEPSYALVSKEYLNFNIRLAYHYSLIDTFCSDVATNNYINFRFFGGGSSAERRSLRAKCIEEILKDLGFAVIREGDLVNAWLKKYPREITEEKLDILGRLMGFMRQLDMLMQNEKVCYAFIDIFKRGDYDLIYQRDFNPIAEAKGS